MDCKLCLRDGAISLFYAKDMHGRHSLSKDQFRIYKCRWCNAVFTDLNIDNEYYKKYYPEDYYEDNQVSKSINKLLRLFKEISFKNRLRTIKDYSPKGRTILEIGCAKGDFLRWLPSSFEKYGIELNEAGYQYVKKNYKDIKIYNIDIGRKSFNNGGKYDIIVMWHVLEHVYNPIDFIKRLSDILAEDGVIIFDVPNKNSIGFNLTKDAWFHLDAPRHLFHYTYNSVKWVLQKYNFEIVKYKANTIDYFQDLSVSFYTKLKTNNLFLNILIAIIVIPATLIVRFLSSLFVPTISEVNSYVVKRNNMGN